MKVGKKQSLLYIFNILKDNGFIKKEVVVSELEINELSFWRYIQEIRAFLTNFNLPYELSYSREKDCYYLNKI